MSFILSIEIRDKDPAVQFENVRKFFDEIFSRLSLWQRDCCIRNPVAYAVP